MLVLDEADRLIDLGFEEDIRNVMDHFKVIQTNQFEFETTQQRTKQKIFYN
jgi:superfamily II DNA/RNA helicase